MNIAHIGTDTIAPRFPHLHPDALDERDRENAAMKTWIERYVDDWGDGDLYDSGTTYSGPQEAFIERYPAALAELMQAFRSGDDEQIRHAGKRAGRAMEQIVREQAEAKAKEAA
ncbi:hypothetical protein [Halomonas caseinilytica]|uniref:hypothetical protein n=1 Tax=Halomonas caseinilytica TaxID=438744 RepID=UPI000848D7E9|nr:hypothetical protein [Halomonas caseinilytica]